jgi:futalosine hydrolase
MSKGRMPPGPFAGRCLVVSAWPPELAVIRAARGQQRGLALASVGVGLVEAAVNTTRLLGELRPSALVLVGTAGGYPAATRALPLGSAAVIDEIVLLPDHLAYLPELVPSRARCAPSLVAALRLATGLPAASVACPLAITATAKAAATAAARSGCTLENLEAFGVARAAARAGVPFAAILGIANRVGPQGHREWEKHASAAAASACKGALALLASLANGKTQRARRTQRTK